MDDVLNRVLSLIPTNESGKFVHGAKNEFTEKIGAPRGIVTAWLNGHSKSYRNYLYQIAEAYNVSVEWLKGETDEKKSRPSKVDGKLEEIMEYAIHATDEEKDTIIAFIRAVRK